LRRGLRYLSVGCVIFCILGMAGCSNNGPENGPGGDTESSIGSEPNGGSGTESGSAGTQDEQPSAAPKVQLTGGAAAAPQRATKAGWTAQEAADHLYEGGLAFNNGVTHQPNWVECTADAASVVSEQEGTYSQFVCRIQVPGVPTYLIRLMIAPSSRPTFDFLGYS